MQARDYSLDNKIVFRIPSFPINTIEKKISNKKQLKDFFLNNFSKEALLLAAPDLTKKYEHWKDGYSFTEKEENRLIYSLLKYAVRMSVRCTPFGLFAGIVFGNWDKNTNGTIKNKHSFRFTRLKSNYLFLLINKLRSYEVVQNNLLYFSNNTIYKCNNEIRFLDKSEEGNAEKFHVSSVGDNPILQEILNVALQGSTKAQLVELLSKKGFEEEDVKEYIQTLISSNLLIDELEPNATGKDSFQKFLHIVKKLRQAIPEDQRGKEVDNLFHLCLELNKVLLQANDPLMSIGSINEKITDLNFPTLTNKRGQTIPFLQVDLIKKEQLTLKTSNAKKTRKVIDALNRLTPRNSNTKLNKLRKEIYARYEHEAIPLLELFDIDTGIGYAFYQGDETSMNSLVDDIPSHSVSTNQIPWNKIEDFLLEKLLFASINKEYEVTITQKEISKLPSNWEDVSDSIWILGSVIKSNETEDSLFIKGAVGSPARLLGRFGYTNTEIKNWLKNICDIEQKVVRSKEIIFADIAHISDEQYLTLLSRPNYRNYEIPYYTSSSICANQQIRLSDIMVSVVENRIVLSSKRLKKEIIPTLSNAHNYHYETTPLYKFLCDLQYQNKQKTLYFSWGQLSNKFKFLPRATYHDTIIHRATWQLNKEDNSSIIKNSSATNILIWRKKFAIPAEVFLVENEDQELFFNFENPISVSLFINYIKNKDQIKLSENLFDIEHSFIKDEKGTPYANEFISVFQKTNAPTVSNSIQPYTSLIHQESSKLRSHSIGSKWLYLKIYCGINFSDELLTEYIEPALRNIQAEKIIEKWFFIRYKDPKNHIRLRLKLVDVNKKQEVSNVLFRQLQVAIDNKLISNLSIESYRQEFERYGAETIDFAESIFHWDSNLILDFLKKVPVGDEQSYLLYGLHIMESTLNSFGYSLDQKEKTLKFLKDGYNLEFHVNSYTNKILKAKKKEYRFLIDSFAKNNLQFSVMPLLSAHEEVRSENYISVARSIKPLLNGSELNQFVTSIIHMSLNRLFKAKQRKHELLLYHWLHDIYKQRILNSKLSLNLSNNKRNKS